MSKFHTVKIAKIKRETKDAVAITFEIPVNLKPSYRFIAGQYITLKTTINNQEVRRAYSICSSTKSGEITVAVKEVVNGNFSVYANRNLKKGQEIEISEPEGTFCLETDSNNTKNYIAFAAGSGITPIIAMVKNVLNDEPNSKFVLVYGNKSTFETIFFDELNDLSNSFSDRLFIQYVYSKEQPKDSLFGRIDIANINFVLNKHKNLKFNSVYLCGPEAMIHTVKKTFLAKGYTEENIYFELFTKSNSKTENTQISLDGNTKITILLDDEETTFNMSQKTNILEAALKERVDAPYSCQGGICSSCLAKVTKGNAIMATNSILSEDEIAEGLILTCQAHPTSAEIIIDFDDV